MTTFYLDSSALVKRYAIEAGTAWVRELCEQSDNVIAVALFGLAEMAAAVNGKRRGGAIDAVASAAILNDLKADAAAQYTLLDVVAAEPIVESGCSIQAAQLVAFYPVHFPHHVQ